MRLALLLVIAGLTICVAQIVNQVHAQSRAESADFRLKVQGDRLIRIEPLTAENPVSRPVLRSLNPDARQTPIETGTRVRLPNAVLEEAQQTSPNDGLPRLQDRELVRDSMRPENTNPKPRLIRVPAPGQSQPEVSYR